MEQWSNYAALGYLIDAAERKGFSKEEIQKLVRGMQGAFDELTIAEAEKVYLQSDY